MWKGHVDFDSEYYKNILYRKPTLEDKFWDKIKERVMMKNDENEDRVEVMDMCAEID